MLQTKCLKAKMSSRCLFKLNYYLRFQYLSPIRLALGLKEGGEYYIFSLNSLSAFRAFLIIFVSSSSLSLLELELELELELLELLELLLLTAAMELCAKINFGHTSIHFVQPSMTKEIRAGLPRETITAIVYNMIKILPNNTGNSGAQTMEQ